MSVVHPGGGMAYNQAGYQQQQVMNMNGGMASGGGVRVDQMKPLVLGQINSFRCKYLLLITLIGHLVGCNMWFPYHIYHSLGQ